MNKKFFSSLVLLLLLCSSAFADPHLWAAHNTIVNMDTNSEHYISTDISTARFFCLTLEAADDEDMPELNVNLNDRTTIPKFTINGGKYSYWNGDGIKTVNGTTESFDVARSDTVMYYNHSTLIGSDKLGYAPTNDAGDWIQFFNEADNGLNGVNVSWEAQDSIKAGSGTVPNFKTTQEQLAGIVPCVEYIFEDVTAENKRVEKIQWRFVRSDDVTKAVSTDKDITIEFRYFGGDMEWWDDPESQYLGANLRNGLDPITKTAGQILEGTIELTRAEPNAVLYQTILRYYVGNDKDECYQWRFVWNGSNGATEQSVNLTSSYIIDVPIIDGQPKYNYARYYRTDIGLYVWGTPLEAKYYQIGKLTIDGGSYDISDQNNVPLNAADYLEIPLVPMLMPGASSPQYMPMMKDNFRPVAWEYLHDRYYARWIHLQDETGNSLSGKTITWTFPDEIASLNGSASMPEYKSLSAMLSADGYFPYIEIVSEDNKITAIKYRFVQSPDIETIYKPENFCLFRVGISGAQNEAGEPVSDLWWAGNWIDEGTKAIYESNEWTLDSAVIPGEGFAISVEVDEYPEVNNTWADWVTWVSNGGDNNNGCIKYQWNFSANVPISQMFLIDDNEILENIPETLSEDVDVLAVQREEVSSESEITDDVKDTIESGDVELIGRFNQLNILEDGTYAVKVTLPDELYDEIEGAASSDLVVYSVTDSNVDDTASASGLFRASESGKKSLTGKLLASDGKSFSTVNTNQFILTTSLKKADGENFTNYSLYLARGASTPLTPEEINEVITNDESKTIDPDTAATIEEIISNDEYEIMTFDKAAEAGYITAYNAAPTPNERIIAEISKDFTGFEVSYVLPSFTLDVEEPVILTFKVTAENVNNLPLHLFKMKGAEVAGVSVSFVKYSSAPDTTEDKDAIFTDGTNKIDTLSSDTVYVSAVFESGSYAPIVATGTAKTESDSEASSSSESSGGCETGLCGLCELMLITLLRRKN